MRDRHAESCFAAVEAAGTTRSRDAVEKLLAHPMLDGGAALTEADAVLVSLMGGPDLTMAEVNRVMEQINQQCAQAQIIMGAAVDEAFRDRLAVTVIATRRSARAAAKPNRRIGRRLKRLRMKHRRTSTRNFMHHTEPRRGPRRGSCRRRRR